MATKAIIRYRNRPSPKRAHRRPKPTVSLALLAGLAPTAAFAIEGFKLGGSEGGFSEAAHRLTMRLTGYEWKGGVWSFGEMSKGWAPLLAGMFAHKAANSLGINRQLAQWHVPFVRI